MHEYSIYILFHKAYVFLNHICIYILMLYRIRLDTITYPISGKNYDQHHQRQMQRDGL